VPSSVADADRAQQDNSVAVDLELGERWPEIGPWHDLGAAPFRDSAGSLCP
jgi:hypothetical protein